MANEIVKNRQTKKKAPHKSPQLKRAMLAALEKSLGVVTTACKSVGIDRGTHYDWLAQDPKYAKAASEVGEISKDFVESKMLEGIKNGNATLMIFYAKTKMKDRGYVETVINLNQSVNNLSELTDEQLDELIRKSDESIQRKS